MSNVNEQVTAPASLSGEYVGELSEAAQLAVRNIQQNQSQIQYQIGGLEVQKARLLGTIDDLQLQLQRVLASEALRFGIPQDRTWHVTPDGKAYVT